MIVSNDDELLDRGLWLSTPKCWNEIRPSVGLFDFVGATSLRLVCRMRSSSRRKTLVRLVVNLMENCCFNSL
jgi:hypothetical protein